MNKYQMNRYIHDGYFIVTLINDNFSYTMDRKCNQIIYEPDTPMIFFKQLNVDTQESVLLLAAPISQIKVIEHIDAANVWLREKESEE